MNTISMMLNMKWWGWGLELIYAGIFDPTCNLNPKNFELEHTEEVNG